jgi:hypothetical protein
MRTFLIAMTAGAALVLCASDVRAKPPGGGDSGSGNRDSGNDNDKQKPKDNDKQKPKDNLKLNGNQDRQNGQFNLNLGRGLSINRGDKLGDRDFDGHRIGALDESKYKDRKDNDWRYRHWGNEWWYWVPGGYWMYWRNGDWTRYDDSNYVDYENGTSQNASFNGPYYEDQNGFYYLQNGRRVYDPQIRRIATQAR